jgi:hypothetical protein
MAQVHDSWVANVLGYIPNCSEEIPSSAKWDVVDARTSLTREPSEGRWN